jgi:mRNA interferase MazF
MFERGKIVLVPFPFTDLSWSKVRPALIVSNPKYFEEDVSVIFISSKVKKEVAPTDHVFLLSNPRFLESGLKISSLFRCNKVATLDKKIVLGEIGFLHSHEQKEIDKRLKLALGL